MVEHIVVMPFVQLYKFALNAQQTHLLRRARQQAGSSGSVIRRVPVRLRWFFERWAASRMEDASVEGDYCWLWVNMMPAVLRKAMLMRNLDVAQGADLW